MQNHFVFLELKDDYVQPQQCFQDPHVENQAFPLLDDKRKDNEPVYDEYTSQSESGEGEFNVLETCGSEKICQDHNFV